MSNSVNAGAAKFKASRMRRRSSSVLGLTLDGSRLDGVVLRRTNGSLQLQHNFSVTLSLDPQTNDAELVGREIRNHLSAAGVKERHCVVGLPLKWVLTAHAKLPDLAEADVASFLQIEAERGFPSDVSTLLVANSRCEFGPGERYATFLGMPRSQAIALENALRAAQLKPVSFSLGLSALQPADAAGDEGVLALMVGESFVGLQVSCGGGIAALRTLEGAVEVEGGPKKLHADIIAREVRITLAQLPAEARKAVRRVRIFGPRHLAQQLADEIELRLESLDLELELVTAYPAGEFGVGLPQGTVVSPNFSLAANFLVGRSIPLEFLPPRVSAWQQFASRYSSGRLQQAGLAVAAVFLVVGGAFLFQQWQLWRLQSQWAGMKTRVESLEEMNGKIKQFRPWFDDSIRGLAILRRLTEAFPEDGSVTAKTVEIRDLATVTCTGVARDYASLLHTVAQLRSAQQIPDVNLGQTRGQPPTIQFSFSFVWNNKEPMQINNRQQLLTIGAIAILGLFAADRLVVDPLTNLWTAKAKQIQQLRAQVTQAKSLLQREPSIRGLWSQMARNTLTNNTSVAEQQLFGALDGWRQDSGVAINGATPQWKHDADEYMTYQCRMDASGSLATLGKFLYDIENDPMALRLDSIEISARDKEGQQLVLGLQISGLVLTPPVR